MAGIHVDAIDRRILREIQLKGDITSAELAETVGASAASSVRLFASPMPRPYVVA